MSITETKPDMKKLLTGLDTTGKQTKDYLEEQRKVYEPLLQKDHAIGGAFRDMQKAVDQFKQQTENRLKEIDTTPKK